MNIQPIPQFSWEYFKKIKRLGFGGQGEGYQLREKETGTIYACKILYENIHSLVDACGVSFDEGSGGGSNDGSSDGSIDGL